MHLEKRIIQVYKFESRVSQGNILCVTLFLLAVNDLSKRIKILILFHLFPDDLSISIESLPPQLPKKFYEKLSIPSLYEHVDIAFLSLLKNPKNT